MSDLLMTGWCGTSFARMAAHTLPLLEGYAAKHGMDFCCVNLSNGATPPSWVKVPNIGAALRDYARVLWVDADVVVFRSQENILDEVPDDAWQAVVEHETECGTVPNCGIWLVTREMIPTLQLVWDTMRPEFLHHPWWEQAAMLTVMGYDVSPVDGRPNSVLAKPTELHDRTHFLSQKWNHHPADKRAVTDPAFVHVTQYPDRLGEIRSLCANAT
jgi:hypothetical protein